jgi:hypothetical protein
MITEIRTYKLKKDFSEIFFKIFTEQSLPMLKRWNVNVVDFGFSLIDNESFYLIRTYDNVEQRKQNQEDFYGNEEWINGPNEPLMNCIETYNTAVIENEKLSIRKISV